VQVGQIGPGQDHPMHQLGHLLVAALLDIRNLPFIAVAGGLLPQEQVQGVRVAPTEHLSQPDPVTLVACARHIRPRSAPLAGF
jgi:hypothetical protein